MTTCSVLERQFLSFLVSSRKNLLIWKCLEMTLSLCMLTVPWQSRQEFCESDIDVLVLQATDAKGVFVLILALLSFYQITSSSHVWTVQVGCPHVGQDLCGSKLGPSNGNPGPSSTQGQCCRLLPPSLQLSRPVPSCFPHQWATIICLPF